MKQDANILPNHRPEDHKIELIEGKQAFFVQNYKPLSEQKIEAIKKYIDKHFGKGFIRPSSSAAAAPVLLMRKLGGRLKFCVDYRAFNKITVKNRYPIPLINETLRKLSSAACFTKLNIIYTFNKIRIKKDQEWLTAFNTRYGQFEYLVIPFGLCNTLGMFQSYINSLLQKYLDVFCTAYLNNILIYSENDKKYTDYILKVLKWLWEKDLQLDIDKCEFSVIEIKYLGLIVTTEGICIDPEKVQAIID